MHTNEGAQIGCGFGDLDTLELPQEHFPLDKINWKKANSKSHLRGDKRVSQSRESLVVSPSIKGKANKSFFLQACKHIFADVAF